MVCDKLINEFPAANLVDEVIPFKDKEVKQLQKRVKQANITTRNFRLKADALRKTLRINDGGDIYIFATTLSGHSSYFKQKSHLRRSRNFLRSTMKR